MSTTYNLWRKAASTAFVIFNYSSLLRICGRERALDNFDFNAPQKGASHDATVEQVEFWIAKQIGEDLVKTYPNRQWHVDVDSRNETIVLSCPSLSKRMGYRLHMRRDNIAALLPRTRKAAGEILERYGISRSKIIDPFDIEQLPRDVRDDAIAADAAVKNAVEKFNSG
jgi:hypothetical protein